MDCDCDLDKLMDAIIDLSQQGIPIEVVVRSLIKNTARLYCDLVELRNEFEDFKCEILESEVEDE